jgi:hypothetical protein
MTIFASSLTCIAAVAAASEDKYSHRISSIFASCARLQLLAPCPCIGACTTRMAHTTLSGQRRYSSPLLGAIRWLVRHMVVGMAFQKTGPGKSLTTKCASKPSAQSMCFDMSRQVLWTRIAALAISALVITHIGPTFGPQPTLPTRALHIAVALTRRRREGKVECNECYTSNLAVLSKWERIMWEVRILNIRLRLSNLHLPPPRSPQNVGPRTDAAVGLGQRVTGEHLQGYLPVPDTQFRS